MAYETYLKRGEWQKRRLHIFERDNFKCQCSTCKSPNSNLEVHHIEYLSFDLKPWEYPDDMLITLCNICHSKETKRFHHEEKLLTAFKMKGLLVGDIISFTALLYSDKDFTKNLIDSIKKIQQ